MPHPDELPHIDIEVVNYHKPVFGTFHSKYMVVDRRIAIIQSNNIQVYIAMHCSEIKNSGLTYS